MDLLRPLAIFFVLMNHVNSGFLITTTAFERVEEPAHLKPWLELGQRSYMNRVLRRQGKAIAKVE